MDAVLKSGDQAPDFEAVTDEDQTIKLSDHLGQKIILYFYPKDDTPGCTTQACAFRDHYHTFEAQNAVVLGVSPDGQKSHQKFKERYDLPFTLIVDEDHTISEAYGVWREKNMFGKKYMGIIRSHFVIDEKGIIIEASYKVKPEASVESALKRLEDA